MCLSILGNCSIRNLREKLDCPVFEKVNVEENKEKEEEHNIMFHS